MKYNLVYFLIAFLMTNCNSISKKSPLVSDSLKDESVKVLRENLQTQSEWVKVHAAEFLIWSGYPEGVQKVYLEEEKLWSSKSPYRIGIWRILSQVAANQNERKTWTDKIMQAFLDTSGVDRIHAAETLAKLQISPLKEHPEITQTTLNSPIQSLALYTQWSVAYTSQDSLLSSCKAFFDIAISPDKDAVSRTIVSYIIRRSCKLTSAQWDILARQALAEPKESEVRLSLLSTAVIMAPDDASIELYRQVYGAFLEYKNVAKKNVRIEIANGLAEKGNPEDLPILVAFLKNENPIGQYSDDADVRSSAAYAILKMSARFQNKN